MGGKTEFSCVCIPDISFEEPEPVECAHHSCLNGKLGDCRKMGKCTVCKCFPSHCQNVPRACAQGCTMQTEDDCPKCYCPVKRSLCPPNCQMVCPYGYEKDERGCNTCKCKPKSHLSKCPSLNCLMLHCEGGFKVDENNCDTCECKSINNDLAFKSKCPKIDCSCESGHKLDENNCPTCTCKSNIKQCPLIACPLDCTQGVKKDSSGCPTCECKERKPCPKIMCPMDCIYGFEKDISGCPKCQCNERRPCRKIACPMDCIYGFEKDIFGCPKCECKSAPETRKDPVLCHPKQCALHCQNGYAKDSNGCDECSCLDGRVLIDGDEAAGTIRG